MTDAKTSQLIIKVDVHHGTSGLMECTYTVENDGPRALTHSQVTRVVWWVLRALEDLEGK